MKLVILALVVLLFTACENSGSQSNEKKNESVPVTNGASKKVDEVAIKAKGLALDASDNAKKVVLKTEKVASDLSAKAVVVSKNMTTEVVSKAKEIVSSTNSPSGKKLFKSCAGCHGSHAEKHALGKSEIIKDWSADKIQTALDAYKTGARNKHGMGMIMKGQASKLSDSDIKELSKYISKL